jgi:FixJ family two-component response regulator
MEYLQPIVSVVDDDAGVRSSLRLLLKSADLATSLWNSAREFIDNYDPAQPGCLLLDVRMPDMNGLEVQKQLMLRGAVTPIIFITGHGNVEMAVEAMQAGAFDFLQKPIEAQDLIDRVLLALQRDRDNRAALNKRSLMRQKLESLTSREREVLSLLANGKPNKIMAADLGLRQRTVEIHRSRLMKKMGAASLAALLRMLVDLDVKVASHGCGESRPVARTGETAQRRPGRARQAGRIEFGPA